MLILWAARTLSAGFSRVTEQYLPVLDYAHLLTAAVGKRQLASLVGQRPAGKVHSAPIKVYQTGSITNLNTNKSKIYMLYSRNLLIFSHKDREIWDRPTSSLTPSIPGMLLQSDNLLEDFPWYKEKQPRKPYKTCSSKAS